jgi:hypothetical protein
VKHSRLRILLLSGAYKALRSRYDARQKMLEKENLKFLKTLNFDNISIILKKEKKVEKEMITLYDTLDNNDG